ncbi:Na+/H+ antiporter family-domain-containing protein [Thamnocephalis sphaerospora]|uniref:Na+/H+ antiporter family-domain-containing protein n=1 Tax=Thamnocephalis sphaerospora TaxID=78915 RepID=A0A4P9XTK3_9FUNG|nr:Na+/H+ antiporter family-domain-containing protein [Thamnocephalis sphaerospora]|eukprot:RKP08770.1 Na+/H+ antiporter family-domain-containing protein [Thamnocephalis sphaerospora]
MHWFIKSVILLATTCIVLGVQVSATTDTVAASPWETDIGASTGLPHKAKVTAPAVVLVGGEVVLKMALTWPANKAYNGTKIPYRVVDHNDGSVVLAHGLFNSSTQADELASEVNLPPFVLPGSGAFSLSVHLGSDSHSAAAANLLIVITLITKQVLMALFCGVFLSATLVNFYNPFVGFLRAVDHYMVLALSDPDHDKVLLFTWFLAGLIALVQRSGGAEGLAVLVTKWATTRWRGLWVTFAMGMLIFFDGFASCLIVGTNMVQVTDTLHISREKLAFFVHATSSPPASLAPVSSWIGYEVGLIADELRKLGSTADPFMLFLSTIVSRFYPIFMIILLVVLNLLKRDFGPMLHAERRAFREGKVTPEASSKKKSKPISRGIIDSDSNVVKMHKMTLRQRVMGIFRRRSQSTRDCAQMCEIRTEDTESGENGASMHSEKAPLNVPTEASEAPTEDVIRPVDGKPRRWFNAVIPITLNVLLIVVGIFATGYHAALKMQQAGQDVSLDVNTVVSNGDSYGALIYASLFTSIVSITMYKAQRILAVKDSLSYWVVGVKEVFEPVLILILAWSIGLALSELRTAHFIVSVLHGSLDPRLLSTLIFLTSCVISFVTGTSWGTMAILFPLAIPLAAALRPNSEAMLVEAVSSILAGATFGDQCSPISDTSVMSALASKCPLAAHITTQLPYALLVAFASVAAGYLPVGYGLYSSSVGILVGTLFIFAFVHVFGSTVELAEGEIDASFVQRVRLLVAASVDACKRK